MTGTEEHCDRELCDGESYHVMGTMKCDGESYHVTGTMQCDGESYHVTGSPILLSQPDPYPNFSANLYSFSG